MRTVEPGEWYGVLGEDVLVLLPPSAKNRVAPIWERVDERASFDEVLDTLISDGLRELPAFVLVSLVGETGGRPGTEVKVVIRGAGEAELDTADGPVTVTGAADTTWVERNVSDVTALRLRVGDPAGTPYAVGNGLVRVASVEHAVSLPVTADTPHEEAPTDSFAPAEPPPPIPVPTLPPPVPTPEPEWPRRHPESSSSEAPSPGPGTAAPTPSPPAAARLVFSSGEVIDVDRSVVVGRAPDPSRRGLDDSARLVTVPSPHQEISSTHLEIRPGTGPDHGSAVVTDLGSTNGTVVVQPGVPPEDLRPGVGVQLRPGAIVDLGEGVTIQVTTP
jgi:pSer/pThr/pTyr-binding forkhead associated (FHA) protein